MNSFYSLYSNLNPEQRQAVDTLDGPVMVIAGPGTGKTQVLAMRVANILRQHRAEPREILCLTFSEAGVAAMRKRLAELAGSEGYYVPVHTFHGFCNDLIREYPEEFPHIGENPPMGELEGVQILEKLLVQGPYELLRPQGDLLYYARPASSHISELKREGIGPGDLAAHTVREQEEFERIEDLYHERGAHKGKMKGKYQDEQRRIQKNKELVHLYAAYQDYLRAEKLYDYNDMILDVLAALQQNEAFQSRISSRYKFFLVDEHQDTNTAQNLVLELLCAEKNPPNIFIVGDEKQAIYRFQGANLENFLYVHKRYPSATLIPLQENYRSTEHILAVAHALISHRKSSLAATLKSVSDELRAAKHTPPDAPTPQLYLCPTHDDEHLFIARKAKEFIATGTAPREIAVLVHEHKDAPPILRALASEGVAHVWESSSDIWQDRFVRDTLRISDFLVSLASANPAHESICALEEKLFAVLHISAFGIPALDVWKLAPSVSHFAHRSGTLLDALSDTKLHKDLGLENPQALAHFATRIKRWREMMAGASPADLFEEIIRATGVGEAMQKEGGDPRVYAATQALWQEFKNFFARPPASSPAGEVGQARNPVSSLADFQAYLTLCQRQNIRLEAKPQKNIQGVRIMTAHGAKGLEFDYVFIPHLHDAKWGRQKRARIFHMPNLGVLGRSGRPKGVPTALEDDAYEDERRLLYVAVTRARRGVFMSHAERDEQGKELIPSLFVQEMANSLAREKHNAGAAAVPFLHADSPSLVFNLPHEKEFIADLFARRKFSVTALNNYLECPWKYFYRNLVRIPQAPSRLELYGSAVHEALRAMFEDAARPPATSPATPDSARRSRCGRAGEVGRAGVEEVPSEKLLLDAFARAMERKLLAPKERARLQARGEKALAAYWERYNGSWNTHVRNEVPLTVPLTSTLILTGILDKLEIAPDGKTVVVVDYKTGRAKTRGEIEGATKNSRGNLKRQLVFYKLLLDKNPIANFHMEAGELDFIESDSGGKLHREQFIISADDVAALETEIYRAADEITSLAFWDKRCLDRTCQWCKLRHRQ